MNHLRWLLFPLGIIYYFVTFLRNLCYNIGFFKTNPIVGKSIGIGNLNLGGSGKSPLTLYLMKFLQTERNITVLSRGYGRNTKGFRHLTENDIAAAVGDEPLMYFQHRSSNDQIFVCENRWDGLQKIGWPKNGLLLLDDVFQHRSVKAGLNLIVTDYSKPFLQDYIFPIGGLRERRKSYKRANAVIVSKCPISLNDEEKKILDKKMQALGLPYFCSYIKYPDLNAIFSHSYKNALDAILVTGIANPKPLINYLSKSLKIHTIQFKDHHKYNEADIKKIHKIFDTFDSSKTIIITTEKDFMRLKNTPLENIMKDYPWFVQSMDIEFYNKDHFHKFILNYVEQD